MTDREKLLIDFAELTLDLLEQEEDWSPDTISQIGTWAIDLDLADDKGGLFHKKK